MTSFDEQKKVFMSWCVRLVWELTICSLDFKTLKFFRLCFFSALLPLDKFVSVGMFILYSIVLACFPTPAAFFLKDLVFSTFSK